MAFDRVWALLTKERTEIRRNKLVVGTMGALPVILVATIIGTDYMLARAGGAPKGLGGFVVPQALAQLGKAAALLVLINDQYMFYLLMTPMILPTIIAAHSVIGEKQARTLEPLLSAPIATWEILAAKALIAAVPATLIGWASYGATVLGIHTVAGHAVFLQAVRSLWTVGFALLTPLLALFSALGALMISTRVNDVRVAQGLAGVGVLPLVGFATYIILAGKYLSLSFVLLCAAVLVPLDLLLLAIATRLFQREAIICRWK